MCPFQEQEFMVFKCRGVYGVTGCQFIIFTVYLYEHMALPLKKISFSKLSKKHYIWGSILLAVVLVSIFVSNRNGNGTKEFFTVEKRDVVEEVTVSGRVEAGTVADLGFEVSGKVASVNVSEGDQVSQGQVLVSLDLGTLLAELSQAQADVLIKEAETSNAKTNLEDVVAQQDTLVESAYRTLLSDDLEAVADDDSVTVTPPQIAGRYTGSEGRYKIRIVKQESTNDYNLYTFGLEQTGEIEIKETGSTPLGTKGLFVSFPANLSAYDDTAWYVDIPNVDGDSYTQNLNAYEEALKNREVTIESAQAKVFAQQSGTSIAEAELVRAQADVARKQAEIAKRRLIAPFAGKVGNIDVDAGESVAASVSVLQIISEGDLGVEIDLPEIDSVKVSPGDKASITLDAFGDEVVFDATVLYVNVIEKLLDNVAVYEARAAFDDQDARIASGMTAEVTIVTDSRSNVLAVPIRAIETRDDGSMYVLRKVGDGSEEVTIQTGLRGSDSFVEVLSGLQENDTILIPE